MGNSSSRQRISTSSHFSRVDHLLRDAIANDKLMRHPYGEVVELMKAERAVLLLMEQENPQVLHILKQGEFVMNFIRQSISTMVMVVCKIDDFHLPLTPQVPVFKVARRSFIIALPGLIYGLTFPPTLVPMDVHLLTERLHLFSRYENLEYVETDIEISEDDTRFWQETRNRILSTLRYRISDWGLITGLSPTAVGNQASELLRANRVSDAVGLIMTAMLRTFHQPTLCDIVDHRRFHPNSQLPRENEESSYPSIGVFTAIIEAQQHLFLLTSNQSHLLRGERASLRSERLPVGFKFWRLNQFGIIVFLGLMLLLERFPQAPNDLGEAGRMPGNGNISSNPAGQPGEGEANSSGDRSEQG